ncbi:MAG: DUF4388 domain-containing protein [Thermoanaerobaculia bacterium]|nr:DUF4388 domain-containing protein [Thermoanaerobaculia bacterium]
MSELQLYLSDTLPPLIVADSIRLLLEDPNRVATEIHAWSTSQYRSGTEIPISDYLFHAVKKIHLMGEFRLVPREPFVNFLVALKRQVVSYCPAEDRELLQVNMDRLGEGTTAFSSPVEVIFRQAGAERRSAKDAPEAGSSAQAFRGIQRFALLLERLGREVGAAGDPSALRSSALTEQVVAAAARNSRDTQELEQSLQRLKELGIDVGTGDLFKALGQSLPGWVLPETVSAATPEHSSLKAMHRIVAQAADPAEGAQRFQQMVKTATDRFNEGSLAQAVAMLDLAERIIAEKEIDPGSAELIRRRGNEALDLERLRKYAESPDQHSQLRRVLNFFLELTPEGLLAELRRELKREKRRLLLLLLEIHGAPARAAAFEKLKPSRIQQVTDQDWYFRRNLLYLLRRIPRPEGPMEEEVDIIIRHTELRFPTPMLKEAIANLGQLKHDRSEQALGGMLRDIEAILLKPGENPYDSKELRLILDRVVAGLARFGTPGARRAVVEHALKRKTELGDTMSRLTELAGQDLSEDPQTVEKLIASLKSNLPFKLLGLVLHQNDQNLAYTVESLSSTPLPAVRQAFEDSLKRFPDLSVARLINKALAGFDQAPQAVVETPVASLAGDLEIFGLPALLQSLAESSLSGALSLKNPNGESFALMLLKGGKLLSCQTGALQGDEAFYQLLERPQPGTFFFSRQADRGAKESATREAPTGLREILPLSLEGMRRYDEFQQARAIVPDDVPLTATSVKATPHPDESDGILLRDLWMTASKGATPLECEASVAADCFRIRRLLVHWVESGALAPA